MHRSERKNCQVIRNLTLSAFVISITPITHNSYKQIHIHIYLYALPTYISIFVAENQKYFPYWTHKCTYIAYNSDVPVQTKLPPINTKTKLAR